MKKTALKTLTYSVMHLTVAVAVAYALTRDWRAALAIGLVEPIFQTIAFAVHERVWARAEARGVTRPPRTGTIIGTLAAANRSTAS